MPRDGSGVYTKPFPSVVDGTTIESAVHNGEMNDIAFDLNAARPIVAGGTGATSALQARDNLDAEASMYQVTNYDTQVWEAGSFYSVPGATAAPTSGAFLGTCVGTSAIPGGHIRLEVRETPIGISPPAAYIRGYNGATWTAWQKTVSVTTTPTGEGVKGVQGDMWYGVNGTAPTSAFQVWNHADMTGTNIFSVNRDGVAYLIGLPSAAANLTMTNNAGTGTNVFITNNGSRLAINGLPLSVGTAANPAGLLDGDVIAGRSSTTGYYFFGGSGQSLGFDGTKFNLVGGALVCGGNITATGVQGRNGTAGTPSGAMHNWYFTGSLAAWLDTTSLGNVTLTSDYRIKKDVIDLPGMWDTVKALRPIKYTQAEFSPPSHIEYQARAAAEGKEVSFTHMFEADDVERWGFIAHELQATLTPSAASGVKDSPNEIQSPNPFTVIAALTKALQEAMARIEALEAA